MPPGWGQWRLVFFHLRVPDCTLARSEIFEISISEIRGARFGDCGQHLWGGTEAPW